MECQGFLGCMFVFFDKIPAAVISALCAAIAALAGVALTSRDARKRLKFSSITMPEKRSVIERTEQRASARNDSLNSGERFSWMPLTASQSPSNHWRGCAI
ncbi:hypothetical protein BZM27_39645 [Paraburkholderia steynii]|uniref:Uncharacterized protein n=1 Tax=Paraburkholderia steynii TaxID=1245441 RepID=A0A4R0X3E1_9BURK|nr:hypothetical protein BZM27_39645 [Paraburkholderia steynii]